MAEICFSKLNMKIHVSCQTYCKYLSAFIPYLCNICPWLAFTSPKLRELMWAMETVRFCLFCARFLRQLHHLKMHCLKKKNACLILTILSADVSLHSFLSRPLHPACSDRCFLLTQSPPPQFSFPRPVAPQWDLMIEKLNAQFIAAPEKANSKQLPGLERNSGAEIPLCVE